VDSATWFLVDMADHADKGAWPIAGGVLDQSESFCRACRVVWNEDAKWEAEKLVTE